MAIKESILTLFDDNVVGAISAKDMRIFVEAIFDTKENEIHVFEKLEDIETYRYNNPDYPIEKFDVFIITDTNDLYSDKGIYIALKTAPGVNDVLKVGNVNYDEFIQTGESGQLISLDADGKLTWIEPIEGYYIQGRKIISEILSLRPNQKGVIYIAANTDLTAEIPGNEGDGYSWDGLKWNNIGQLRGPKGDVEEVAFATQYEVDGGFVTNKAISPKTLKDSSHLKSKENTLGKPTNNGDMLVSTIDGDRSWETPVRIFGDLKDVDTSNAVPNSFIYYTGTEWTTNEIGNIVVNDFLGLTDTPNDYSGNRYKGLRVSSNETELEFTDLVYQLNDLQDVSNIIPNDGQILVYDGATGTWKPEDNVLKTQRPSDPKIGTMIFDATLGKPIWFNGTEWVDSNGTQI
jgi:hypothetical protein